MITLGANKSALQFIRHMCLSSYMLFDNRIHAHISLCDNSFHFYTHKKKATRLSIWVVLWCWYWFWCFWDSICWNYKSVYYSVIWGLLFSGTLDRSWWIGQIVCWMCVFFFIFNVWYNCDSHHAENQHY